MKGNLVFAAVLLLVISIVSAGVLAQEKDNGGELTVPWQEFKRLLNLDEEDIVLPLETFHKLLAQTGVESAPPHTSKQGNVVISRAEFQNLVNQMKPHLTSGQQPPFDFLVTKAVYDGELQKQNAAFSATLNIQVLKENTYLKVPILPSQIALNDIRIDGRQGLILTENGYHYVVFSQKGEYTVKASFSLKSALERGPNKIDLPIQQTPITLFNFRIPLKEIDIEIPQAQYIQSQVENNKTAVSAVITPGTAISVRWRKQIEQAEKIPAKLYSEVYHLISIEDDVLKTNSDITYNILHSEIDAVRLSIPDNMNVLGVYGEGVGEWHEITQQDQQVLVIPFTYGKKGSVKLTIITESPLSETGMANLFSGFRALDAVRETGFMGVELNTSAEVIVSESSGLEKVSAPKLPANLISKSAKPLMMGFKYLKHPFNLVLDVKKHQKVSVPIATINSANVVTLFTEDGKIVNRLVYQVKNSAKQFLEIRLPEKADVWSVFVGNQPVESSLSGSGKLLIPLLRSNRENNRLNAFPVEVVYAISQDRFALFGTQQTILPTVDLMKSEILWSVYLPNDYDYLYFKSTLEKEEIIRGFNVLSSSKRRYNKESMDRVAGLGDVMSMSPESEEVMALQSRPDYASEFRNVPLEQKKLSNQVLNELQFGGRLEGIAKGDMDQPVSATGILPIQIQVPTGGQVYRFARTIINPDDTLEMSVVYAQNWVIGLTKWALIGLLMLLVYLLRNRIKNLGKWVFSRFHSLAGKYSKHHEAIKGYAQSRMTPFVLFGLIIVFVPLSIELTLLAIFFFWLSLVDNFLRYRWKRKDIKAKGGSDAGEMGDADVIITEI